LNRCLPPLTLRRKQIQLPKHLVFCFLEYRAMEKVQKPSKSECYTPSSEPLRIYIYICSRYQVESIGSQFSYWYLSDDVRKSNRGAFNSKHQKTFSLPHHCHLHHGVLCVPTENLPAISSVLAASVLLRVYPCGQYHHNYAQGYVLGSDHSWHNSEQVFQGE
jgi:hypothetical protein